MLRLSANPRRVGAIAVGTLMALTVTTPALAAPDPAKLAEKLVKRVKVNNVVRHLNAFQRLGFQNGDTRAASTPGHAASAEYVQAQLEAAGYLVARQEFPFTFEETLAESATVVTPAGGPTLDPTVMTYSANTPEGGVTADLVVLPDLIADPTPGCEATDFPAADLTGKIVLIQRGSCTFQIKHDNAAARGVAGVLVYQNNTDPPDTTVNGRLTEAGSGVVPIAGLSKIEGQALIDLAATGPVTIDLELRVLSEERTSFNLIAETQTGRNDNVVMAGAHLDSVTEGPGINDNGSGSAALLEIAIQAADTKPKNKLRFAWWSAEEYGLVGSGYYASQLGLEEQLDIALYLNFDMIGSPNFARFIYDGDDSDAEGAGAGPPGSAQIEDVFEAFFVGRGLAHEGTDFSGRSDYQGFIDIGIPAGGLFTGAEGRKTAEQAATYGGTADVSYDPCYHSACDTISNVNTQVLDEMSDAIAYTIGWFGTDTSTVNGSVSAKQLRRQTAEAKVARSKSAKATTVHPDHAGS